jgi:carbon-monoxide dehydrogenase medium subunit
MKPGPFEYTAPATVDEVVSLLGEHGDEAKVIAGGQSLVPMLSMRLARPAQIVDVNRVDGLAGITDGGDHLAFGATTRERDAERSTLVARRLPVMAEALPLIGHVSIRNRGTIGGSIAHADASAELPAVAMVTDGWIVARGPGGEREITADDFFVSHFTTSLADDECVLSVRVPTGPVGAGWAFQEVARRHGDFALVGVAAMVATDGGGTIRDARVCMIGVGERPARARDVERSLVGQDASRDTFAAAAADAVRDLDPGSDMHGSSEYRRHLAGVVVRRALGTAAARSAASGAST